MRTTLQHGIIKNFMKKAQQHNFTQLYFSLYLYFPCQNQYIRERFYQSNVQPSFFLLVLVRFILILLKLLQKVPKVQASEYLPTNLCALSVFLLLLCCNLSSHKMRGVYQRIKCAKNSLKLLGI